MVKDGGYVNVVDTLTVTSLPKGSKFAILCGGTIDMSSLDVVSFGSDTIINDCTLKFKDGATVYANGKELVIESATKVEGIPAAIYGGGNYPVTETYLDLRAGSYKKIYGGGDAGAVREDAYLYLSHDVNADLTFAKEGDCYVYGGSKTGTVYGDTVVIVEGNVNAPLDHTSHTAIARFYGGSENGDVKGSTSVIISENAEFNYIYGGCAKGTVGVATYVNFSAKAMSIYGGSGTVTETNVIINDGWVHQVFGGCEGSSMTGNTNVTIKGGYIDRRIVGGCYNNYSIASGWTTENYVTGICTVTLRDEATYNLKGDDHGITALSRHKTNHEAENGIVFFENDALKNSLNDHMGITILLSKTPAYDSYKIG